MRADDIFLGFACEDEHRGKAVLLSLHELTHMHLIGTTGFGKTTLMVSLAAQLIDAGVGVAVVDPAGDISRRILITLIQSGFFDRHHDAFERFAFLDVARAARDQQFLAFNILAGDYDPHTAASIVIEAYRRVWPTMQDGNWINIELMTTLAAVVLAYNKLPLLPYLEDFYRVPAFRTRLLANVQDTRVEQWLELLEVKKNNPKIPPIVDTTLKRIMLLALPPVVGYALSQQDNLLDGKRLLADNRAICLNVNLEDENATRLLGSLFTRQMETAIKTRNRGSGTRRVQPYLVMLDEVHNFIAHSGQAVDTMFAEARRAGVFLVAAHQYWGQLREGTAGGFSQCGIVALFQQKKESGRLSVEHVGLPIDRNKTKTVGHILQAPREQPVSPTEQVEEYVEIIDKLPVGYAFVRLPHNRLHLLHTLPTEDAVDEQMLFAVEQEYLRRYFRPLAVIEDEIRRVRGLSPPTTSSSSPSADADATLYAPPPPAQPPHAPPRTLVSPKAPARPPSRKTHLKPPKPLRSEEEQPPEGTKKPLEGGGKDAGF
jgi:energy-coupling factor transporter ATP-binding protein EcfA2